MEEELTHDQIIARLQWFHMTLWNYINENNINDETQKCLLSLQEDFLIAFSDILFHQ